MRENHAKCVTLDRPAYCSGLSIVAGTWEGGCPLPMFFFNSPPPSKPMPYHGAPHLQMKPPLKSKSLFWEMILRKKKKKKWKLSLILVFNSKDNTAEISQKRDFLIWSIQNLVGKVKLFENITLLN